MTWGCHGTFCTFVDLLDNESDFLRFNYEARFIGHHCIPKPPSITSLKRPPHRTRALTASKKAITTPAAGEGSPAHQASSYPPQHVSYQPSCFLRLDEN